MVLQHLTDLLPRPLLRNPPDLTERSRARHRLLHTHRLHNEDLIAGLGLLVYRTLTGDTVA